MASAVDSRLAYARLSAVATASRLPTANRGSNNSYTTSWDTTFFRRRHSHASTPNLLDRNFEAAAPDAVWLADISYIPTDEGWLYLAAVKDLATMEIVGWSISERLKSVLCGDALKMAIRYRRLPMGLIHHSDRRLRTVIATSYARVLRRPIELAQYCSDAYQARLGELGFLASMSGKGNCYDNAVVETFFKTIKSELIWRTVFMSRSQAETAIAGYIDGFYNPVRRHSTLDFTSLVKFGAEAMRTV